MAPTNGAGDLAGAAGGGAAAGRGAPTRAGEPPLARYLRLMEALAGAREPLTLSRLAERLALPPPTVHRLLGTLVELGLAERLDGQRSYAAGPRLHRLAHLAVVPASLATLARPALAELARAVGETAFLARLNGRVVESVAMEVPEGGDKAFVQPGRAMPLHAAASAKAIFAFQEPALVEAILAEPLARYTPDTRTDPEAVRAELAEVRAERFAVCDNELDPGVVSYAVPVVLADGSVLHSVGVCGIAGRLGRLPRSEVRARLDAAAAALAPRLGP